LTALAIASIVFSCVFGGALFGISLGPRLPDHHLNAESKDVIKLAIALIATMGALVLGLLIASAKSAYDTRSSQLATMSAEIVVLDRLLAHYGPETRDTRAMLRRSVTAGLERYWPAHRAAAVSFKPNGSAAEALYESIAKLSPQNASQRSLQNQAMNMAVALGQIRMLLFEGIGNSIPYPFLVILVFWLTVIFASFGLFAPRNATVIAIFLVCAVSVSAAIFLVIELDRSFEGILRVSSAPLRTALAALGR
jgi:hypothetical protein